MSLSEIVITLVIALIVFGPDQLPDVARKIGRVMGQFRKTSNAIRREFYNELYPPADEIRRSFQDTTRELKSIGQEMHRSIHDEFKGESNPVVEPPAATPTLTKPMEEQPEKPK